MSSIDKNSPLPDNHAMAQRITIEERRKKILSYINHHEKADIQELSEMVGSTEFTVRRDLIFLEKANAISRTHGGAMKKDKAKSVWQTTNINDRLEKNTIAKSNIAKAALELINDNESIIIDGGSTTQILAKGMTEKKNLLIVTNSPGIAEILQSNESAEIFLLGGELIKETFTVTGPDAERNLEKYYVDKCILGVTGADPDIGCYAAIPSEASLKNLMINHARESILVIDSTKFDRKAFCVAFPFEKVSTIVTDEGIRPDIIEKLENKGVRVVVAKE